MITHTVLAAGDIGSTAHVTVLAAADVGTMITNAISWIRGIGIGAIILAGSGHILKKVFTHQFTVTGILTVVGLCSLACVVFMFLPTIAQAVTGAGGQIAGGSGGSY
ncbi:Uncharacterised protein [Mycobacteroides abscessus subsp. abscessus]|uniref:hypothetical protein n=1 Tax=Mycobacteroides TaxID=670516 RepID=UPI0008AA5DF6|nr:MULTISPECIES: hypothetical protein [Mycobacteroides]OHU12756.1 hypothetical protein BKG75_17215 [Mycobacteroides chelonae]SHY06734.1 Uncharacterised protein [Mycobacteroides abscessus subsp. abscessus]SIC73849.1 Uncharacterised protein [Mycobacteroides abscessus subsp. abscessus]SKP29574.1 Uncharacterised protein [Mycobacteroides abscessus subsp. abscessus]